MTLNPESKYPTRRTYVVKLRADASAGTITGRLENLVTGQQREFASGAQLLESIAGDLSRPAASDLHRDRSATSHTASLDAPQDRCHE